MNTPSEHWLILGLGMSGETAARLLLAEGRRVSILTEQDGASSHDDRPHEAPSGAKVLFDAACVTWDEIAGCVVSPGFPSGHPWVRAVRSHGVPVVPEYELGWSRFKGKTVAVSGSNGKSTFVKWCAETLRCAGVAAVPCGNYGVPVCDCVNTPDQADALVMELSSFQLEASTRFAPDVAVLLNVLPNHLDRHGDMEHYTRIKLELFRHMPVDAPALLPYGLKENAEGLFPGRHWITFGMEEGADYQYRGGQIIVNGISAADLTGSPYCNEIMGSTGAAACAWLDAMGIERPTGWSVLRTMKPLPHRQETVATLHGVAFVNDSKATNLAALGAGVEAFGPGVRLIAGGQAKEKDFKSVKEILARNVRSVYLIGRDAEKMAEDWEAVVPCRRCVTLECAVRTAWRESKAGETVLLSPGCTSYDQFRNFEERGKAFTKAVVNLHMEE